MSSVGGPDGAVREAQQVQARSMSLFLKNQRRWVSAGLTAEQVAAFKRQLAESGLREEVVLPHGSYLVNLGSPDAAIREKSEQAFIDELQRCQQLGLRQLNIHPGSSRREMSAEDCCHYIAEGVVRALHRVAGVDVVLENSAGGGGSMGATFEQLRLLVSLIEQHHPGRVGVCLDTCHLFAAGYDLRTRECFEDTFAAFDRLVGFQYLRAMHLNDSKADFDSHKDQHQAIGFGKIGLDCFSFLMNDSRFSSIPLILETPIVDLQLMSQEIQLLYSLSTAT